MKHFHVVILFLYLSQIADSQSLLLDSYIKSYPDDDKIILQKNEDVTFELVENRLIAKSKSYEETLWLSDKAGFQRKDIVSFGMFDRLIDISAKTLVPTKKKYRTFSVDDFSYSDFVESGVFHDDLKIVTFNYPNLAKGCRTIKECSNEVDDPHFLSGFYFSSATTTESSTLKITIPESVKLNYKLFNCNSEDVSFSMQKNGRSITYKWKAGVCKKIPYEDNSPGIKSLTPHIIYYIEEYISPDGGKHKVFSNLDDLYSWYWDMTGTDNSNNEEDLIKTVEELTREIDNEFDKVKSIYYWVQSNIKYIAVEYGIGGFQPRPATLVLKRRYGDCKDMSNLIHAMLEFAGIKSSLTWVGTRDLPYSFYDIPTPSVNNHMIVTYKYQGKLYFLDATGGYLPVGIPSSFIQGKEAMIGNGYSNFEIAYIPEVPSDYSILKDSVVIEIENNNVKGFGFASFTGYYGVNFLSLINQQNEAKLKDNLEKDFAKGSNKYHLKDFTIDNYRNIEEPVKLDYSFTIPDYAIIIDSCIYINLNLDKTLIDSKIEKDRQTNFVFDYKGKQILISMLIIPKGYKIDYIPDNTSYKSGNYNYSIEFLKKDNSIQCTRIIDIDKLAIEKIDFDNWNQMVSSFINSSRQLVVLKKL